jgi:hypothetical protein
MAEGVAVEVELRLLPLPAAINLAPHMERPLPHWPLKKLAP